MSKYLEIETRVKPYMIMFLTFFALLKAFAPQDVTHRLAYQISNIGTTVFGIPYFILLFQQKKSYFLDIAFIISLAASILFQWI